MRIAISLNAIEINKLIALVKLGRKKKKKWKNPPQNWKKVDDEKVRNGEDVVK